MYKRILLALDVSHPGSWRGALPEAVAQARAFGATLHLLTVLPEYRLPIVEAFLPEDFEGQALARVERELRALSDQYVPPDVACECHVARGPVADRIVETAESVNADLLVVTARPPGSTDWWAASHAAQVTDRFNGSVLVVRSPVGDS